MTQDHEIMLSVKNGDIQKLGQLFDKYSKGLYNYFRLQINDSSNSEDLVQNVFYSILKYRHTFKNGADFKVWMYTIARNEKISFFKKRKHFSGDIDPEFSDEGRNTPEEGLVNRVDVDYLRGALDSISPDNRELIILNRFTGLPYSQIAEILGCGTGALKVRMHRAMKELKDQFHKISGE
ncbi:MAG: RNA polymerase sigma factor [Desulfobacteraceae bacterium]